MAPILSYPCRAALAHCFGPGAVLAFDYDEALAPGAPRPGDAHMRTLTRRLLARLADQYRVVITSSRSRGDLAQVLDGIPVLDVIDRRQGEPLVELRAQLSSPALLFAGGHQAEPAFSRLRDGCVVGIRVGFSADTSARYFLREQTEIDDLLGLLHEGANRRLSNSRDAGFD